MVTVRGGLTFGATVLTAVLAVLASTVGLAAGAWAVGLVCALVIGACVARGAPGVLGPADLVTVTRTAFACGIAALVADSFVGPPVESGKLVEPSLVVLATAALVLDAVDGRVARRTGTVSSFGARFDGEADAFLMLVLSVYVAHTLAAWVLVIGAARYAFALAGWCLPWMRAQLPPRYWRKVVTATEGIVLTVAAADVLPLALTYAALVVALALLVESFGRDVLWLWARRHAGLVPVTGPAVSLRVQRP